MKLPPFLRRVDKSMLYFSGILLLFLILKVSQLKIKFSDGFTYMYMGKLILEGLVPYRDFFFASPPLQPYLLALGELFLGNHILLLKLIPILSTAGSSYFIYQFMRKKFGNLQAITSSILFLFSFIILLTTDYSTGIHLTLFFVLGAMYFIEEDKSLTAGIFGGLALLVRLYALFPLAGAGIYYLIYKKKNLFRFSSGTFLIFLPVSLIFQIISNGAYLDQIFFFRLHLISGIGLSKWSILWFFITRDFLLVGGSLFYLFLDKEKKKLALPLLATALSLVLYTVYSDIYYLYLGLITGFLAMFTTRFIFLFEDYKNFKKVLALILILFILINSFFYVKNYSSTANITFTEDLVNFVKDNSLENQTIYGSFEIAPLISLLSGRELAGDIADTNPKNIMTNTFSIGDLEDRIKGVRFIIAKGVLLTSGDIAGFGESIPINYLQKNCNLAKTYPIEKDFSSNTVFVYICDN